MRSFFKVIVPPSAAFIVFAVVIKLDSFNRSFSFGQISDGTIHSLMAYFYFFWPLLLVDALLTQIVMVVPVWNRLKNGSALGRAIAISVLVTVCILFSLGVSIIMWGSFNQFGHWFRSFIVMNCVQLIYWIVVTGFLGMIEKRQTTEPLPESN
jgi:hypothetical protein